MAKQKKADIWMPLYISDYLGDTMHLNTEQHGAYLLLIMAAWKAGGNLPNSPEVLQAISRLSPAKWKTNEPLLKVYFHITPEFWIHNRVVKELSKAQKNSEARRKSGAIGATKRWQTDSKTMANAIANDVGEASQMDRPSPSPNFTTFVNTQNPPAKGKDFS